MCHCDATGQEAQPRWTLASRRRRPVESNRTVVFPNETGKPMNYSNMMNRHFKPGLKAAKLPEIRFHDLRHTYASLLIQKGESLPYIRDQLGHHSIKVTVDIYGHLVPGGNKEAVDNLDDDATKRNLYATKKNKELTVSG